MSRTNRKIIIGGLVLTLIGGSLPYPLWDHEFADTPHLLINECIYWALTLTVMAYIHFAERRSLTSIGFRKPDIGDLVSGVAVAVVTVAGLALLYFVILPALPAEESETMTQLSSAPGWWLVLSSVRASVSEEILFRGYPIERLQEISGSRFFSAALPLVVFALAHVTMWGWGHVLVAAFGGAMFTGLYLWRRNLWVTILAHCLCDVVALAAAG